MLSSSLHQGTRSAVIEIRGKWYRLKGCGNNSEGFVVEMHGDKGEETLRGCSFEHTVAMEL